MIGIILDLTMVLITEADPTTIMGENMGIDHTIDPVSENIDDITNSVNTHATAIDIIRVYLSKKKQAPVPTAVYFLPASFAKMQVRVLDSAVH
jgi:hypothetical protein